jgi:hypothetical protein
MYKRPVRISIEQRWARFYGFGAGWSREHHRHADL